MRRIPLAARYAELNARYWQGQLPPTVPRGTYCGRDHRVVMVTRVATRWGVVRGGLPLDRRGQRRCGGRFYRPTTFRPARVHVISGLGVGAELERRILLHEMVHVAVYFGGLDAGADGHGPAFLAELERLASLGEGWALEDAAHYRPTTD